MSIITVTSTAGLQAALQGAVGGDTILLAPGTYSGISISNLRIEGTVNITSLDPSNAAILTPFSIVGSSGLSFSDLEFSCAGFTGYYAFNVSKSDNIHFTRLDVHGSMNGNPSDDAIALSIQGSSNVSVTNSEFQQLKVGISTGSTGNIVYSGNSFHDIRVDGMDFAGSSNVQVLNNTFTDFYPATGDHPDAIQFWTAGTTVSAHDILISGNMITRGSGATIQGIFLKDEVGTLPYQNVKILNNVVTGEGYNGIAVLHAQNLEITGNKVTPYTDVASWIRVENADASLVTSNWAGSYVYQNNTNLSQSGNQTVAAIVPTLTTPIPPTTDPDSVTSSVSCTLGATCHTLTLTGSDNINGTGNDLGNKITGNIGSNVLTGGAGADIIADGGGTGIDTMTGKTGADTYYVNNAADKIVENTGEGTDTAFAAISYALAANVENLSLTGTANISGTGNGLNNRLTGNSGANILNGGAGSDIIDGGEGADMIIGGNGADRVTGGAGNDTFQFAPRGGHDVITDFGANGDLDRIDISGYLGGKRGGVPTIEDHGSYTTIVFSRGESIDLLGVHAADLQLSGNYIT